ncbi:MAG: PaaI family thioesterase [Helicobacteraceae bacterium]|jgi:acyl-coenzyme A thioesterase PaaI-like protein|nr:PaaI family thioesterase [Helicobacteraceae bacterium]
MPSRELMVQNTHLKINTKLCGEVIKLAKGYAKVQLKTDAKMVADEEGLIHGGFIFGAADFAAMSAVNEANVVLTGSTCRFIAPSAKGDIIDFEANIVEQEGPKAVVEVVGHCHGRDIFTGSFKTYITKEHILKG